MILTGRPVAAQEALSMGLASRVVPNGKSLETALEIAEQLLQFPPICMNADRTSCYNACYNASSFDEAFKFEFEHGMKASDAEGKHGAKRFADGKGRHGNFSKL